jgi:hypothetical protein
MEPLVIDDEEERWDWQPTQSKDTTEPVRREVPDNGLREFLIYELHVFGAVSYPLLGKSQVVRRGRRCRKTPASRLCVGRVADAISTNNGG